MVSVVCYSITTYILDIPCQACLLRKLLEVSQHLSANSLIVDEALDLVQIGGIDLFAGYTLDQGRRLYGVADSDQDDMGLEAVSMHQQG